SCVTTLRCVSRSPAPDSTHALDYSGLGSELPECLAQKLLEILPVPIRSSASAPPAQGLPARCAASFPWSASTVRPVPDGRARLLPSRASPARQEPRPPLPPRFPPPPPGAS